MRVLVHKHNKVHVYLVNDENESHLLGKDYQLQKCAPPQVHEEIPQTWVEYEIDAAVISNAILSAIRDGKLKPVEKE